MQNVVTNAQACHCIDHHVQTDGVDKAWRECSIPRDICNKYKTD